MREGSSGRHVVMGALPRLTGDVVCVSCTTQTTTLSGPTRTHIPFQPPPAASRTRDDNTLRRRCPLTVVTGRQMLREDTVHCKRHRDKRPLHRSGRNVWCDPSPTNTMPPLDRNHSRRKPTRRRHCVHVSERRSMACEKSDSDA